MTRLRSILLCAAGKWLRWLAAFAIFLVTATVLGQEQAHPLKPPDRSSPRAALKTFLDSGDAVAAYLARDYSEQRNTLSSVGFNADWDVSESFNMGFDYHVSRARSLPDDGITGGSQTAFSLAGKVPTVCTEFYGANPMGGQPACRNTTNFWTQEFQFNSGLPVASRALFPDRLAALAGTGGNSDYTFDTSSLGSQILRITYQEQRTEHQAGSHRR